MGKIRLRAVEPEDVNMMFDCDNDEEARIWTDYAAPLSRRQLLNYALTYDADPFRAGQLRLIAEPFNDGGEAVGIGIVDLYDIDSNDGRAFVGIYILPEYRHSGMALEALEALKKYCASVLGLRVLAAKVSTGNGAALGLFKQAGYTRICLLPSWHRIGSDFHDIALLVLFL